MPLGFLKHRKDRSRWNGREAGKPITPRGQDGLRKTTHTQRTESEGRLLLWGRSRDTVMNGK